MGWFLAVAAGMPPGRFTADEIVKLAAVTALGLSVLRWVATLSYGACMAAS